MEKVWKNQKGITMISLLAYLIGLTAIMGIIAVITSFYNKNIETINDMSEVNSEFNKFDTKLIQETKIAGNEILEVSETTIKFKMGNTYTYADNKIYQNAITISKYVKDFAINYTQDGNKQILNIYITLEKNKKEIAKNVSYVIEKGEEEFIGGLSNVNTLKVPEVDGNGLALKNTIIKPSEDSNLQIVIPAGFAPVILQTGKTQSEPGENGRVREKMSAENWNNITTEDINKGIVVVDGEDNEFVWIPIPNSQNFIRTAWITKSGYDENGKWSSTLTIQHQLANQKTASKWWEVPTTTEYTQMVNSIEKNKGFYIARYEAGRNGDKPQSKRDQTVWGGIKQKDALTTASTYNSTLHSHLMYGIEWDSVLKWLQDNAKISTADSSATNEAIKTMNIDDIQTDSRSWGNYSDSTGNAGVNNGSLQTSGKSEYWKANNIYDLAGNVYECTQENWSTGSDRTLRSCAYNRSGSEFPAAVRDYAVESFGRADFGFRFSLYL